MASRAQTAGQHSATQGACGNYWIRRTSRTGASPALAFSLRKRKLRRISV